MGMKPGPLIVAVGPSRGAVGHTNLDRRTYGDRQTPPYPKGERFNSADQSRLHTKQVFANESLFGGAYCALAATTEAGIKHMKYRVFGRKRKAKAHIVDERSGMTLCKAENNLMLGAHHDFDHRPQALEMCKLCAPPKAPAFLEAEGRTCTVFQIGETTITVGKKYPRYVERCAEIRRGRSAVGTTTPKVQTC